MAIEEEFLHEMRMQTAILRAAHAEALDELAQRLLADKTSGAIIGALRDSSAPLSAREILDSAEGASNIAHRTVQTKLAELSDTGVVRRLGRSSTTKYELTGLVG